MTFDCIAYDELRMDGQPITRANAEWLKGVLTDQWVAARKAGDRALSFKLAAAVSSIQKAVRTQERNQRAMTWRHR